MPRERRMSNSDADLRSGQRADSSSRGAATAPELRTHSDPAAGDMHQSLDLALFGEPPTFSNPLHVGRPHIPNRERLQSRINGILDRAWLTNDGPLVQELECRIAERLAVRNCVLVCNGTLGLQLTAHALDLSGEVIMPALTFIATPHALRWIGIQPVFADVDPHTMCLDPDSVEKCITPRTTGILGVHLWGHGCATDGLQDLATQSGLKLFFDASHAFGCLHNGRLIGGFGNAEVISFHATKSVNSGEGGAIVTNDDQLASRLRRLRNFGFCGIDMVADLGINAKMSEFAAAVGLTSLEDFEATVHVNRQHAHTYALELANTCGVRLRVPLSPQVSNCQYVVLEIDSSTARLTRDQLLQVLWSEGVRARRYFFPGCHRSSPYQDAATSLPVTDRILQQALCVPTGTALTTDNVRTVCDLIRRAVQAAGSINSRRRHAG